MAKFVTYKMARPRWIWGSTLKDVFHGQFLSNTVKLLMKHELDHPQSLKSSLLLTWKCLNQLIQLPQPSMTATFKCLSGSRVKTTFYPLSTFPLGPSGFWCWKPTTFGHFLETCSSLYIVYTSPRLYPICPSQAQKPGSIFTMKWDLALEFRGLSGTHRPL